MKVTSVELEQLQSFAFNPHFYILYPHNYLQLSLIFQLAILECLARALKGYHGD
jgi:hypothetical protein